jgi:hypothetical protein
MVGRSEGDMDADVVASGTAEPSLGVAGSPQPAMSPAATAAITSAHSFRISHHHSSRIAVLVGGGSAMR